MVMMMRLVMGICREARLHGEFCQGQAHARRHVDDDLLRHRVVDCAAKHRVAAEQAREKRVELALLAIRRCVAQEQHRGFVHEGKQAQVARVLPRRLVHERAF